MGYYVVGEQGQKYGPAEISVLNQWIVEGRLYPTTMLEDEVSGGQIAASAVRGLTFPMASPPPSASPYPRTPPTGFQQAPIYQQPVATGGKSDFTLAIAMAIASPILTFLIAFGGLITGSIGIRAALRARDAGHPMAVLAIVLNVISLAIAIIFRLIVYGAAYSHLH